jgi:hypothetical protein
MKLSYKLQRLKRQKSSMQAAPKSERAGRWFAPSTWVLLGLCVILAAVATLALFDFVVGTKIPPELVGLWEVQEGPQQGGTFEFFRSGTMEVHLVSKKREVTHKTRVAVKDKTLMMFTKDPLRRQATSNESIIRELTADTLILELEKGDVLRMVRIE